MRHRSGCGDEIWSDMMIESTFMSYMVKFYATLQKIVVSMAEEKLSSKRLSPIAMDPTLLYPRSIALQADVLKRLMS